MVSKVSIDAVTNTGNLKMENPGFQVKHLEPAVRVQNKNMYAVIKAGVFVIVAGNLACTQKSP